MVNCVICGNECTGKTCSGACRAKLSRRKPRPLRTDQLESCARTEAHGEGARATLEAIDELEDEARTASLEDYQANPKDYATRTDATKLNWGVPMSTHELQVTQYTANRVTIPGDWDYEGVVTL